MKKSKRVPDRLWQPWPERTNHVFYCNLIDNCIWGGKLCETLQYLDLDRAKVISLAGGAHYEEGLAPIQSCHRVHLIEDSFIHTFHYIYIFYSIYISVRCT
jgi:hypothetical protein